MDFDEEKKKQVYRDGSYLQVSPKGDCSALAELCALLGAC